MNSPLFDIECALAANIITLENIANAPIIFVDTNV